MIARIVYRASQTARHLRRRPSPEVDATLQALLPHAQWELLARMAPADRRHALRVHQALVRRGFCDTDLLTAALLHDCGKLDGDSRVTIVHRVLKVLLNRIRPERLYSLANGRDGWLRSGLHLAVYHHEIGARLARSCGATERTCWFIEHHDDGRIPADTALAALQEADARE